MQRENECITQNAHKKSILKKNINYEAKKKYIELLDSNFKVQHKIRLYIRSNNYA